MIKLTIEDLQETAEFKVIEKPLIQKPIIAESDVVTIDNNLSTYVTGTQKRELTVNLGYLDREGYEILRGFRDRQYENLKYPKATITSEVDIAPDGQIVESEVTKNFNLTTNDNALGVKSIELVKIGENEDYIFEDNGRFYVHKATDKIASYNGETISTDYISTTGALTTGATVYYVLATPVEFEITKGTLVELKYARAYAGQTNVWSESNNYDLPVKLDYTYRKNGAYLPIQITDSTYEHLTDTLEAPLDITKLGGDTSQTTYTGKNLFNPNDEPLCYFYINGNTLASYEGRAVSTYISISSNTTYTVTKPILSNNRFAIGTTPNVPAAGRTLTVATQNNNTDHITITSGASDKYLVIYYKQGSDTTSESVIFPQIQVEKSATQTSFEPYVGGTASPNPDYPQAVRNVTGLQQIKVCGKNLVPQNFIDGYIAGPNGLSPQNNIMTTQFFPVDGGSEYSFSGNIPADIGKYFRVCYYDADKNYLSQESISAPFTTTVNSSAKFCRFSLDNRITNIQCEKGNVVTDYEAYKEQVVELNLGKNLFNKDGSGIITSAYFDTATSVITARSSNDNTIVYIPCSPNTTYTFQKIASGIAPTIGYTTTLPVIGTTVYQRTRNGDYTISLTTGLDAKYLVIRAWRGVTVGELPLNEVLATIQIEKGSTATSYAPYFEPIELCKIGDYQDYIYKSGDSWILHKAIGKEILPTSGYTLWNTHSEQCIYYINGSPSGAIYENEKTSGISSQFNTTPQLNSITDYYNTYARTKKYNLALKYETPGVLIQNKDITTLANFHTWIANNPITLYFPLATPTETEITNDNLIQQLEDLYSTYGFDEYTIIETSADDDGNAKPVLEATQGDITDKGTEYRLEGTKKMPMEYKIYGQAIQDGTPSTSTPIPIETVKGNNSITFTGPSGRKDYVIVGKMTLADQRIIDNCGTAEQVAVQFRESKQI